MDLSALPAGLVAIAGRNGAGKTTLLESVYAALYGEYPTRPGGLYGVATEKDSRIEVGLENGQPYRCLVAVDALRQSSEMYLYDGETPLTDGKVRSYLAEVERRFGSARLMLSAALSCQSKRGSFLDLSKVERKELLAEILDTGGLQRIAEAARERARTTEAKLERLLGELDQLTDELDTLAAEAAPGAADTLTEKRGALSAEVVKTAAEVERTRERYAELKAALAAAEQTTAARRQLEADIKQAEAEIAAKHDGRDVEKGRRDAALARLDDEAAAARAMAARLPELEDAEEQLEAARKMVAAAEQRQTELLADVQALRTETLAVDAQLRPMRSVEAEYNAARQQAGLLGRVPCTTEDGWARPDGEVVNLHGSCPLLTAAQDADASLNGLGARVAEHDRLAGELDRLVVEQEIAIAAAEAERVRITSLRTEAERLDAMVRSLLPARTASEDLTRISERTREVSEDHAHRFELATAEIAQALIRVADLKVRLTKTPEAADVAAMGSELEAVTRHGQETRQQLDRLRADLSRVEADIVRVEEAERRRKALTTKREMALASEREQTADLTDWRVLERAFGRDGIQALEIDAAGPELSSLTTELLVSCFGPRFEVRFVTQVPKADGKGSKEVFDVAMIDHDRGREGAVDSLSGGEKTVVSEAISLALAIYVGRHSGRRFETLFRDETAGALDPDNAARYVAMLRRARVMAGAHQVLYIAQQPEVWEAADAVLWCEDGRVDVRS